MMKRMTKRMMNKRPNETKQMNDGQMIKHVANDEMNDEQSIE